MEGEEEAGGGIYSGDALGEGEDGGEGGVVAVWTERGDLAGVVVADDQMEDRDGG